MKRMEKILAGQNRRHITQQELWFLPRRTRILETTDEMLKQGFGFNWRQAFVLLFPTLCLHLHETYTCADVVALYLQMRVHTNRRSRRERGKRGKT